MLILILISNINEEVFKLFVSSFTDNIKISYPIGDRDDIAKLQIDFQINQPKQHEIEHW